MPGFDIFEVIALIMGVFATVRKLNVRARQPEEFPHVRRADFESWRAQESAVYTLVASACFAKVVLDLAFANYVFQLSSWPLWVRLTAMSIDLLWLVALVVAWRKRAKVRRLRASLGIDLSRPPPK